MKEAKLFENGRSQAVRLPKEFRFKGKTVGIRRIGNAVVLLPKDEPWGPLFSSFGKLSDEEFMPNGREQPTQQQEREEVFP